MLAKFLLIFILLLSSCSSRLNLPRPSLEGPQLEAAQRHELLAGLATRYAEVRSFKSLSKAKLTVGTDKVSMRYAFVFEAPDSIRLEGLPLNSAQALSLFVSKQGLATFIDPAKKRALSSFDQEQILQQAFAIPLTSLELAAFLRGSVFAQALRSDSSLKVYSMPESGAYQLSSMNGDRYYKIDETNFSLLQVQIRESSSDKLLMQMQFGDYRAIAGIETPHSIEIDLPFERLHIVLKVRSISVNSSSPERLFEVEIPSEYSHKLL